MSIKLERDLACIDLETTGVDTQNDRIVDIAVVKLRPNGERHKRSRKINPGIPIPKEASAVHGIYNADVQDAPTFASIAASLFRLLECCDITGYNIKAFDVPLLSAEFKRCGIEWPTEDIRVVDAYRVFKVQEPRKLANALWFYTKRELGDDAHDASADAEAALDVLIAQEERYSESTSSTLEDLDLLSRDPEWVDSDGKVKWLGDTAVINFGKWAGQPLRLVDPTYFQWVLKKDFGEDFKAICRSALDGEFPERPSPADSDEAGS